MATYEELIQIWRHEADWKSRVSVAMFVKAEKIADDGNSTGEQLIWAAQVYDNEQAYTDAVIAAVLAEHNDVDAADIIDENTIDDLALQAWVDEVVDDYIGATIWPLF